MFCGYKARNSLWKLQQDGAPWTTAWPHLLKPFLAFPPSSSPASACVRWVRLQHELLVLEALPQFLPFRQVDRDPQERHWNWITHQSDGKRHSTTDDKPDSSRAGRLPGLLRRSLQWTQSRQERKHWLSHVF